MFVQGIILFQGNYIHSRKLYSFKELSSFKANIWLGYDRKSIAKKMDIPVAFKKENATAILKKGRIWDLANVSIM